MRHTRRSALVLATVSALAFALIPPRPADAQEYGGCVDFRGIPVQSTSSFTLNDVAMASVGPNGQPVITYNPNVVGRYSPPTRRFWYMHECGHHALGHGVRNIPFSQEQEADCFGIVSLVRRGEVNAAGVRQIQSELALGGAAGDWQHLPGPQRAFNLNQCLRNAGVTAEGPSTPGGQVPTDGPPQPRCHPVTTQEARTDYETRMVSEYVRCNHCGCTYSGCGCLHPADLVVVPRNVPITRVVPVTRTVCE